MPYNDEDSIEVHPYLFIDSNFRLPCLNYISKDPADTHLAPNRFKLTEENILNPYPLNPRIVNEYSWLWISREGKPCRLTEDLYNKVFPNGFAERDIRDFYADSIAELTEFFRSGRRTQGIMEFAGLSYSKKNGETSDNFLKDISNPEYDKYFEDRMYSAFSIVGISIDNHSDSYSIGEHKFKVILVNDVEEDANIDCIMELSSNNLLYKEEKNVLIKGGSKEEIDFLINIPNIKDQTFILEAYYYDNLGKKVSSKRKFKIGLDYTESFNNKLVLSNAANVSVSSTVKIPNATNIDKSYLIKGDGSGFWSSYFKDDEWVILDLKKVFDITDISLIWQTSCLKYECLASLDGEKYTRLYEKNGYEYGNNSYSVNTKARYIKFNFIKRFDKKYGFSLYSIKVYGNKLREGDYYES